ncbi:methyltransferase domain-containing protein [Leptolyngbya iicbica]|nr:methyltransferase domain-containing protein [Leptolyngbya sp. LK]
MSWRIKILVKIILKRLPIRYSLWKKIGIFKHGRMESVEYSYIIFKKHLENVNPSLGFVSLELGPGDSVLSAVMSKAFGGSCSYLVDSGYFANFESDIYKNAESFLRDAGLPLGDEYLRGLTDEDILPEKLLTAYNCHYLTQGLDSLKSIPSNSVDFIWSQAVLEHVRKRDFLSTQKELRRIIRDDGKCSHTVDLKDHLGGSLNNLRFSERVWESEFMASSGFYTNRIRYSEMLSLFDEAGFLAEVVDVRCWSELPIEVNRLSQEFEHLSEEELCIKGFTVILTPKL